VHCLLRLLIGALAAASVAGCASRPINEPISHVDVESGYRASVRLPKQQNKDLNNLVLLAFSGGGTRAAAFSYGVLEELRRTEVVVDGRQRRLLDDVVLITGVSGGSFTALAYALYGDKLFSEYETRFLKRDVEGALIDRAINPFNWPKLIGGSYGRSELAADYYDEILFQGATFADLEGRPRPRRWLVAPISPMAHASPSRSTNSISCAQTWARCISLAPRLHLRRCRSCYRL